LIAFIVDRARRLELSTMLIREAPPAEVKTCPFCKEPNAVDASRCRACTSTI
jgi:hypothetical protein